MPNTNTVTVSGIISVFYRDVNGEELFKRKKSLFMNIYMKALAVENLSYPGQDLTGLFDSN